MVNDNVEGLEQGNATAISPSLLELFHTFLRIGLLSFGGPAAQIALMHRMIVDEHKWLNEKQYLNALNFCMLLPGPEAMQLATYAGWRIRGVTGGLLAGLLFVIPGALVILAMALIYVKFGNVPLLDAVFLGIKAAVIMIVIEALLRVSKRSLSTRTEWLIAAAAFVGIFFFNIPYPLIILGAAAVGFLALTQIDASGKQSPPPLPGKPMLVLLGTLFLLWALPIVIFNAVSGFSFLAHVAEFFSILALVTFGGAYAVLAYMAQDVVGNLGWLTTGEMMDGLGLAETTPGPLILVTEFVAFVAGFREQGIGMAIAAASVTLWVTFLPCFIWIFAGAPYIDWLGAQARLRGALSAITAAVVGVILNLSLWFALHVLFKTPATTSFGPIQFQNPALSSLDWRVVALSVLCGLALFKFHWSVAKVILLAAIGGIGTLLLGVH